MHRTLACNRFEAEGIGREPADAADAIWGVPGREVAGAVSFRSWAQQRLITPYAVRSTERVDESDIAALVAQATRAARRAEVREEDLHTLALPATSGRLPKIALHLDRATGHWHLPSPERLSTHIVKHEDRAELPGEAAVEALCQRSLARIGIRAAHAWTSATQGLQLIWSERTDRETHGQTGQVKPVHQEQWVQAAGLDPGRLAERPGEDAGWRAIARRLAAQSTDPGGEIRHLTKVMAACALLAHRDCHRGNLGLRHARRGEPFGVELAPLYDVSSADGQGAGYSTRLALAIEGTSDPDAIRDTTWTKWADATGHDPDEVLDGVAEICRNLPDALSDTARRSHETDELVDERAGRRRVNEAIAGTARRCQALAHSAQHRGESEDRSMKTAPGTGSKRRTAERRRSRPPNGGGPEQRQQRANEDQDPQEPAPAEGWTCPPASWCVWVKGAPSQHWWKSAFGSEQWIRG